jgi:hypothetical protein
MSQRLSRRDPIFSRLRKCRDDPVAYLTHADAIEERGDDDSAARLRKQGVILQNVVKAVRHAVLPGNLHLHGWDSWIALPDGYGFYVFVLRKLVRVHVVKGGQEDGDAYSFVTELDLRRQLIEKQPGYLERRVRELFRPLGCEVEGLHSY